MITEKAKKPKLNGLRLQLEKNELLIMSDMTNEI